MKIWKDDPQRCEECGSKDYTEYPQSGDPGWIDCVCNVCDSEWAVVPPEMAEDIHVF